MQDGRAVCANVCRTGRRAVNGEGDRTGWGWTGYCRNNRCRKVQRHSCGRRWERRNERERSRDWSDRRRDRLGQRRRSTGGIIRVAVISGGDMVGADWKRRSRQGSRAVGLNVDRAQRVAVLREGDRPGRRCAGAAGRSDGGGERDRSRRPSQSGWKTLELWSTRPPWTRGPPGNGSRRRRMARRCRRRRLISASPDTREPAMFRPIPWGCRWW